MTRANFLRQHYLDAIGVQTWVLKSSSGLTEPASIIVSAQLKSTAQQQPLQDAVKTTNFKNVKPTHESHVRSNSLQHIAASQQSKQLKSAVQNAEQLITDKVAENTSQTKNSALEEITAAVTKCNKCPKRNSRLQALAGQGQQHKADVFFITEPPSAEEDRIGVYFPDRAGILSQAMLQSVDLSDHYYISGLLKCHSMQQFVAGEDEIKQCFSFLASQISILKPKLLVSFGRLPAQYLLHTKQSFNELINQVHEVEIAGASYPLIVSCHPGFLLRNPQYKKQSLRDLLLIKQLISARR